MQQAGERPESFAIRARDLRRVDLQRFPYHFLFRVVGDVVRISSCDTIGDVPLLPSGAANGPHRAPVQSIRVSVSRSGIP